MHRFLITRDSLIGFVIEPCLTFRWIRSVCLGITEAAEGIGEVGFLNSRDLRSDRFGCRRMDASAGKPSSAGSLNPRRTDRNLLFEAEFKITEVGGHLHAEFPGAGVGQRKLEPAAAENNPKGLRPPAHVWRATPALGVSSEMETTPTAGNGTF